MNTLPGQPVRHPNSYVDPAGALYEDGGSLLRGLRADSAQFYVALLENPAVRRLLGSRLIDTDLAPAALDGYPVTLRHRRIEPNSFCFEWPAPMLRDAALLTLDLCLDLVDERLTLQDASPWNVVFDGPTPTFVDFTSIVPQDPHLLWVAYDQFCRLFLYPLTIASRGLPHVARLLLTDAINGVDDRHLVALVPKRALLGMPWLLHRVYLPRMAMAVLRRLKKVDALLAAGSRLQPSQPARRAFFRSLRRHTAGIRVGAAAGEWSRYYGDMEAFDRPDAFNPKMTAVARILDRYRPATVVDIACNRGGYAMLAARAGARVIAFDADEASVAMLYALAKDRGLPILPLVMDCLNPSPARGWRTLEFPAAPPRIRSQMALALALVHHLAISQRQTFERIVPALADYADAHLLTEFVPLDDPRARDLMLTNRRDMSWYTLENFLAVLGRAFTGVQVFPSFPSNRSLVLCSR